VEAANRSSGSQVRVLPGASSGGRFRSTDWRPEPPRSLLARGDHKGGSSKPVRLRLGSAPESRQYDYEGRADARGLWGDSPRAARGPVSPVSVHASFITEFWEDQLVSNSRQGLFLVLVGFLCGADLLRQAAPGARDRRLLRDAGGYLRRAPARQTQLPLGTALLRPAGCGQAGKGGAQVSDGPADRDV